MRKANLKNPQELIAYKQAEKEREERRRMAEKKKLENSIFVQKDPKLFKFGKWKTKLKSCCIYPKKCYNVDIKIITK